MKAKDAASFDKAYIDAQYNAHVETVGLFKAYANGGDNARIKQFATELLPTLEAISTMSARCADPHQRTA